MKRYDLSGGVFVERKQGDWVTYADAQKALDLVQQRNTAMRKKYYIEIGTVKKLRDQLGNQTR